MDSKKTHYHHVLVGMYPAMWFPNRNDDGFDHVRDTAPRCQNQHEAGKWFVLHDIHIDVEEGSEHVQDESCCGYITKSAVGEPCPVTVHYLDVGADEPTQREARMQ